MAYEENELIVVDSAVSDVVDAGPVTKVPPGTIPIKTAAGWAYKLPSGKTAPAKGTPVQVSQRQASAMMAGALKNQKQVRVGPVWHRRICQDPALVGQTLIRFFERQPADTFEGNYKQALIKTKMDLYGARFYFEPAYYMTCNEAAIESAILTVAGRQQLANRVIPVYNAMARSICLFKVNRKDLPYLRTSKLMPDLKWIEWGYDNNAGAAAWSSAIGTDPAGPYFLFKTPEGVIDPIKLDNSVNEVTEVQIQVEFPAGEPFPAAADMPSTTSLATCPLNHQMKVIAELFGTIEDSLYAG